MLGSGPGLGTIREYGVADDRSDFLVQVKDKARLVNDYALNAGARDASILWSCEVCGGDDNLAWSVCMSCGASWPEERFNSAKDATRRILEQPYTLKDAAEQPNPHRLGAMAGYVLGRVVTVAGDGITEHPQAFKQVEAMPPPPKQKDCSLPDDRILKIIITEGEAEWPYGS